MKKIFWLGSDANVDLYYNDLYCLQHAWKDLEESLNYTHTFLPEANMKIHLTQENNSLVCYYAVKKAIFDQNFALAREIIQDDNFLLKTFRKILLLLQYKKKVATEF